MKLNVKTERVPTFKQWIAENSGSVGDVFPVTRIFVNDEWKTVTFVAREFKLNHKSSDKDGHSKTVKGITKIVTRPCVCFLRPVSPDECEVEISPAGDTCENPQVFTLDDYGFSLK